MFKCYSGSLSHEKQKSGKGLEKRKKAKGETSTTGAGLSVQLIRVAIVLFTTYWCVGVQLTVNDIQKVYGDILSSVSGLLLFRLLLDLTAGQISMLRRTLVFSKRRNKLL